MACTRAPERLARILVNHSHLVVSGHAERPDRIFVDSVINHRVAVSRRIRVKRLTLDVEELKRLIIIVHGLSLGIADDVLWLRIVRLLALEIVVLIEADIIKVFVLGRVVCDALVETTELVVEDWLSARSTGKVLNACVHAANKLEVSILVVLVIRTVDALLFEGAAKSLLLSVLVDAP